MAWGRAVGHLGVALALAASLAACSGSSDGAKAGKDDKPAKPAACKAPPVTVDLRAGGTQKAGSSTFEVTDAAARREAILPGKMAFDPSALSALESEAGVTPLALYDLYLADYDLPLDVVKGTTTGQIVPAKGQTLGTVSLVPTAKTGFETGDTVRDGKLDYKTSTTLRPLSVTVYADGDTTAQAYTDVAGKAKILWLDKTSLCVDFDITVKNQGSTIYRAKGVVDAPVVRASDAVFVT